MDMFDGFVFLEEKKKSLIPILCQYDFLSALTAAFSITSWRKNRGAQESCLALNSAMVENTEWGRKTIFTPKVLYRVSSRFIGDTTPCKYLGTVLLSLFVQPKSRALCLLSKSKGLVK